MSMLTSILFSQYRSSVLGLLLLHPEQAYYLRQIARLTGTTPGTLQREMIKLEKAGLVTVKKIGNQTHYQANRSCPIFEELASILRKTSGLVDVLLQGLLPLENQIQCVFVFGSAAGGKASVGSDIDIMIIGDLEFADVVAILHPYQETLGREINPKLFTGKDWIKLIQDNGAFIRDVLSKPKLYIIGNEHDLLINGGTQLVKKSHRGNA
ncbi:nucleotidyltransferase domain-containing protein [Polynucleobacter sp.]|uniref:nucleotidyltransferase domain-containing protein n=1 Tax=Polynucleobacter sp. TaxID=2029855 RepID=UPI0037C8C9FB